MKARPKGTEEGHQQIDKFTPAYLNPPPARLLSTAFKYYAFMKKPDQGPPYASCLKTG